MRPLLPLLLALALIGPPVLAQGDPTSRSWNQPVEPFRIAGNLYYVGASDVTAFLFTTPKGHILIDGGFVETAPLIRASVAKLGFRLEDVKILLSSHAHVDHAGGLAALKEWSGAKFYASEKDAALHARGGRGDFLFGDRMTYPAVQADRLVRDREKVTLGGTTLTAHLTPGHTEGCTTWTAEVQEGGKKLSAVFVCSTTVNPGVVLLGNPKYPSIAADYARSFETLRKLPCDFFFAPHGSFFDLTEKAGKLRQGARPNPFLDAAGWRRFLDRTEERFRKQLAEEKTARAR